VGGRQRTLQDEAPVPQVRTLWDWPPVEGPGCGQRSAGPLDEPELLELPGQQVRHRRTLTWELRPDE
jgi:hypothetical protein